MSDFGCKIVLFADDVKLYSIRNKLESNSPLQSSLDLIAKWADCWQLQISIEKCSVMYLGRNNPCAQYFI